MAETWKTHVSTPFDLHEWYQPQFTHAGSGARSRLDRMYCNQHISFQLDRNCACIMLDCDYTISHHKPISFARATPCPKKGDDKPIAPKDLQKKGWAPSVLSTFQRMCKSDPGDNPVRRLVLLKDAIKETTRVFKNIEDIDRIEALGPDDLQGYAMTCLRALEKDDLGCVAKCGRSYPRLQQWVHNLVFSTSKDPLIRNNLRASAILSVRNHVVELAREEIGRDATAIRDNYANNPDGKSSAKESVIRKLKRLLPGESSGINAMKNSAGATVTSPEEIAQVLKQHWKGVFKRKQVNTAALQIWMEELYDKDSNGCFITGLPAKGDSRWIPTRKHLKSAIACSKNSMPGPDGIPALAYKILGPVAENILYDVVCCLGKEDHHALLREAYRDRCSGEMHAFNDALLCCLPKKPCEIHPEFGEVYAGEDTRPLALVNTDNRIIASAARRCWEIILEKRYISSHQQGFLKGRYMMNNILDIDYNAMTVSLKHAKGALLLFDFKAAFPSVSHDFLIQSLHSIGLPDHALNFIRALYDRNKCDISFKGAVYPGFNVDRGVRQGCPISPLLFAAAVDVLLQMLAKRLPTSVIRAFADDIGAVVTDFPGQQAMLERTFKEFEEMSGLELNIKKTVCIPLWEEGLVDIPRQLREGAWKDLNVSDHGTYLGFVQGPGKEGKSWQKPIIKYSQRCNNWQSINQGIYFATTAYNTFAVSVLSFIAQLEVPSKEVLAAEAVGLFRMTPGAKDWRNRQDLFFLKESYGLAASFQSVHFQAQAAKLRVVAHHELWRISKRGCEGYPSQFPSISRMHQKIKHLLSFSEFPDRAIRWAGWYNNSYIFNLISNQQALAVQNIKLDPILRSLAGSDPWNGETRDKIRPQIQRAITAEIKKKALPDPQVRLRDKIKRWYKIRNNTHPRSVPRFSLAGPPHHTSAAIARCLCRLGRLVAPRVAAAVFKFLWNGWCCKARFQQRDQPGCECVLGCIQAGRINAQDAQEHYCHCPAVHEVWKTKLRTVCPVEVALHVWLLACGQLESDDMLTSTALMIYATFMAINHYRHHGKVTRPVAKEFLKQAVNKAVFGHPKSMRFVEGLYHEARPSGLVFRGL